MFVTVKENVVKRPTKPAVSGLLGSTYSTISLAWPVWNIAIALLAIISGTKRIRIKAASFGAFCCKHPHSFNRTECHLSSYVSRTSDKTTKRGARCPLWVKSRHMQCSWGCPLWANSGCSYHLFDHRLARAQMPAASIRQQDGHGRFCHNVLGRS